MTAVDLFLERFRGLSGIPRVLELGTHRQGDTPGHWKEVLSLVRKDYYHVGADLLPGEDVDEVVDAHELSCHFPAFHFDAFVSRSTFEHLRRPWLVAEELGKVCRPGAFGFVQTHQTFPLHCYPSDYFRFSLEALGELFCAEVGWKVLFSAYEFPARVVPMCDIERWNAEAPAWLNSVAVVERIAL